MDSGRHLKRLWRGELDYARALAEQRSLRERVIAGEEEEIWLLEHASVVTVGRRGAGNLSRVREAGIPVLAVERGGLATWHGLGQLVAYPVVHLERRGIRVRDFVHALEGVCIDLLEDRGVPAARNGLGVGVYVGNRKIASVGIHVRRGVTLHGLAVNLCNDLGAFDLFDPCGLGLRMTSAEEQGIRMVPQAAAQGLGVRLSEAVDTLTRHDYPTFAEGS